MIKMMENIKDIKALILDIDGVIWKDNQPIGELPYIFNEIKRRNLSVILATNNSTGTADQYQNKLKSFGVNLHAWQIINSSHTAAEYLKENYSIGSNIYILGEAGLVEAVLNSGFRVEPSPKSAAAVVVGMDRKLTFEKLLIATRLIRNGAEFVGSNPDKTFPTPDGLIPGAGSILAAIEAATGVTPVVTGKPNERIYNIALSRLKLEPEKTLVVGDRLETDIQGAQICGCHTALVLSGVTSREQAMGWKPQPDIIANDLSQLIFELLI